MFVSVMGYLKYIKKNLMTKIKNIKEIGTYSDILLFSWELTDYCNYNCSYCYAKDFNKQSFTSENKSWKMVLARLKTLDTKFKIELLGGEPTLHPEIFAIIKKLNCIKNCIDIQLITNLSKSIQFFKKLDILENNKLTINASYHYEYDGFYEKCLKFNNFKYIKFRVTVNVGSDESYWNKILKILNNKNIHTTINILYSTPDNNIKYNKNIYTYFSDYLHYDNLVPVTYIDNKESKIEIYDVFQDSANFTEFKCTPLEYTITMYGEILNACTRVKTSLKLTKENMIKSVICPLNKCKCNDYIEFKKVRI